MSSAWARNLNNQQKKPVTEKGNFGTQSRQLRVSRFLLKRGSYHLELTSVEGDEVLTSTTVPMTGRDDEVAPELPARTLCRFRITET